ncbi:MULTISPECIES: cytochrome c [unclassified Bradyrhizobium]|uniref:Cytochrome c n=1 Tax=Bradyrhizobium sp. LLZ17 TaxID=3239388 RepID=A0AB39XVV8_9BRAD
MSFTLLRLALLVSCYAFAASFFVSPAHCEQLSFGQVERGRYLAAAGDCEACHTAPGGKPFAGGRAIPTPFGTIYSANITPDRKTGIGSWSDDQFYRALHQGIAADGSYLYPAFPYPWYTKVTREDSDALKAFLSSLEPVAKSPPPNELAWPLDDRLVMKGWNELFFREGTFQSNDQKSPEWNRGAYLVQGFGHCGACHTPTNVLGAAEKQSALRGGKLQDWFAPNLTADLRSGLGNWSIDEIVTFLKTGRNDRTVAYGPMSEVITFSTSKLNDDDLKAIATYLKDVPAAAEDNKAAEPDPKNMAAGKALYVDNCAGCHQADGQGVPAMFPRLQGSSTVQDRDPTTIARLILYGAHAATTDARPTQVSMPAFDWKLSDQQIADLATYVRNAWGNSAPQVTASKVGDLRRSTPQELSGR